MKNPLPSFVTMISAYLINLFAPSAKSNNQDTLRLVHVVFRHGDRTPLSTYPKDPHAKETYQPYGLGHLTNKGKERAFQIGKALRKRYNDFLGESYKPNTLEAVCTEVERTQISLKFVLAGLYSAESVTAAKEVDLNSVSFPYNIALFKNDHAFAPPLFYCPKYMEVYEEFLNSAEGSKIQGKHSELFKYLSENTGVDVHTAHKVCAIYDTLTIQEEWGLELPEWTKKVYPELLREAALDDAIFSTGTADLNRLAGGYLLKRIIDNSRSKIDNNLDDLKLFLYSAHDINVVNLLRVLKVFTPHIPPCGAYILIELHEIDNVHGIKIYYQNYSETEPKLLNIPTCDEFCPLDQLGTVLRKHLPTEENWCTH